jgi:hypothetical protein
MQLNQEQYNAVMSLLATMNDWYDPSRDYWATDLYDNRSDYYNGNQDDAFELGQELADHETGYTVFNMLKEHGLLEEIQKLSDKNQSVN